MKWNEWLVYVIAVLFISCGPVRPPQPKPPALRTIAVVTSDSDTGSVYVDDTGGGHQCEMSKGYCDVVATDHEAGNTFVTVNAPGFQPYRVDAILLPQGNVQLWLGPGCGMPDPSKCVNLPPLQLTRVDLPRIIAVGQFFQLGSRAIFVNGISDFRLFARHADGEDITLRLDSTEQFRTSENAVVHRVWLMADTGFSDGTEFHFNPKNYPSYFAKLRSFAQTLAVKGHYAALVLFVNTGRIMPSCGDQQVFIDNVAQVMREEPNLVGSAGNEYDQDANAWCHGLRWPTDVTFSAGSGGSQIWPDDQFGFPHLHYGEYHVFADEWQRKASHEPVEMTAAWRIPVWTTEMTRPDQNPINTLGAAVVNRWKGVGATCKLLAAGCLYHSASGRQSLPIPPSEQPYIDKYLEGVNSVPVSCQPGAYGRRDELNTPDRGPGLGVLRAYERRTGDTRCVATTPW